MVKDLPRVQNSMSLLNFIYRARGGGRSVGCVRTQVNGHMVEFPPACQVLKAVDTHLCDITNPYIFHSCNEITNFDGKKTKLLGHTKGNYVFMIQNIKCHYL